VGRVAVAISLLSLVGCTELQDDPSQPGSSDEVFTEWDSSVDFTAFHSYTFVEPPEDEPETVTLNVTRVRNAIRKEYELLGFVEAEVAEDADVEVIILTETQTASMLELDCVPTIYWYGSTGGYNSCALIEIEKHDVTVGTIMVGLGDASHGEIVFNGILQGIANGQDTENRINRAVEDMFDTYPADQTGA
jgi:hypothetical protein